MTPETKADIEELVEEFEFLGDWEERYRYLIDLGQALVDLSDALRLALGAGGDLIHEIGHLGDAGHDLMQRRRRLVPVAKPA